MVKSTNKISADKNDFIDNDAVNTMNIKSTVKIDTSQSPLFINDKSDDFVDDGAHKS